MAFTSATQNSIDTAAHAKAVALSLTSRFTHESQAVFAEGKVSGYVIRLSKKDNRGVTVGQVILRDEDAKDFVQSVRLAKSDQQIQCLIGAWFAEAN